MENFYYIDLFAGIGGMRLALEEVCLKEKQNPKCLITSEIKPYAIKVYNSIFNEEHNVLNIKDIKKEIVEKQRLDFILAGFPCQPFSYAGKGLGFADTRGTMFHEVCKFLNGNEYGFSKPKGFLLENVEGLLTHDKGRTFSTIINELEKLDYYVSYIVLDSYDFGLAQKRKRVYICGSLYSKPNLECNYKTFSYKNFKDIREYNLPIKKSKFIEKIEYYCKKDFSKIKGKRIRDKRAGNNNIHSWDLNLRGETTILERKIMCFILEERRKKSFAKKYGIEWKDGMPIPKQHIVSYFLQNNIAEKEKIEKSISNLLSNGYLKTIPIVEENEFFNSKNDIFYKIPTGNLSFPFVHFQEDNLPLNTIVATDVTHLGVVEDNGIRQLSIKELLQAFGYPIEYEKHFNSISKAELFDLFGNTICIPVVSFCIKQIFETFVS